MRVTILNDCTNLSGREGYLHCRTIVSRVRSMRRVVRYSGGQDRLARGDRPVYTVRVRTSRESLDIWYVLRVF